MGRHMQSLHHPESLSEVEIRQEARFVLWALRWCALGHQWDNEQAQAEIGRGFELADASETVAAFREFGRVLCQSAPSLVWHGPACGCVSSGEMHVLHALAQVADHRREEVAAPAQWWRVLVPAALVDPIDRLARQWLAQLHRAGIEYPGAARLIEALSPLQVLTDDMPARNAALN
jgi:hypothetical protein